MLSSLLLTWNEWITTVFRAFNVIWLLKNTPTIKNPNVHCHDHNSPPLNVILKKTHGNQFIDLRSPSLTRILTDYRLVLSFTYISPSVHFLWDILNFSSWYSGIFHVLYMFRPPLTSLVNHSNIIKWRLQICGPTNGELLYLILGSNYSLYYVFPK